MWGAGDKNNKLSILRTQKAGIDRVIHAAITMTCQAVVICSVAGLNDWNARANQLPKQQLLADGSVFLIRLLQLWIVHSNQAAQHPPANAAYHALVGEEDEE